LQVCFEAHDGVEGDAEQQLRGLRALDWWLVTGATFYIIGIVSITGKEGCTTQSDAKGGAGIEIIEVACSGWADFNDGPHMHRNNSPTHAVNVNTNAGLFLSFKPLSQFQVSCPHPRSLSSVLSLGEHGCLLVPYLRSSR
jgi:hypothetical protein